MITIEIYRDSEDQCYRYSISGHANYDIRGKDIVCAGVSAISQSVMLALREIALVEHITRWPEGYLEIEVIEETHRSKEVQAMFKVLGTGLYALETEYPNHIEVFEYEVEPQIKKNYRRMSQDV